MISLLNGVLRIRPRDIPSIVKLFFTFAPAKIYKRLYKDIWIITEYPENARDNGYWLFKYVRENYPEKRVFYPIKRTASDYEKVAQLGNVIAGNTISFIGRRINLSARRSITVFRMKECAAEYLK